MRGLPTTTTKHEEKDRQKIKQKTCPRPQEMSCTARSFATLLYLYSFIFSPQTRRRFVKHQLRDLRFFFLLRSSVKLGASTRQSFADVALHQSYP
jgi:hypothetical protein